MAQAHILVVEDENIIAMDIQQRLTQLGYAVPAIAASGQDALQKAADLRPDLVLMDIVLKGDMDGVEAAAHLRTHFDLPVVYLTAYADDQTLQRAKTTEPFGYLLKPIIDRQLQTTVEMALYRHSREKERQDHAKWFDATLRNLGEAVLVTTTSGHITFMNPVAEALTGWQHDEALGRHVEEVCPITHDLASGMAVHPIVETLRTGVPTTLDHHHLLLSARDGTVRFIADSATPIRDEHGILIGGILVFRDITERQRREETMLTARKLEAIGTLAGGIAHTFNSILTIIAGRLSLAKLYAQDHAPLLAHLTEAERAVQQAEDTVRQLLTFARGGVPLKQPTALGPLLHEATRFVLASSSVQWALSVAADLWLVEVDSSQIRQVMHQITLNAVQAMPAGGMLHIKAENVSSATVLPVLLAVGPYVRVAISDQGEGISAAERDRIFDPYFTTKAHHSGLGLATAHAIVQKHGGCIHVESVPGVGTTMFIYLPAMPTARPALQERLAPASPTHGKILIMDDEETIRVLLQEMLTRLGYEVESVRDGAAAIDLYRRAQHAGAPFAAIVMDLVILKGMGGKETMAKLREMDPEVKAIVSSGSSNDSIMANFRQYGFRGRLPKPYQLSELSAVLQHVLHQS